MGRAPIVYPSFVLRQLGRSKIWLNPKYTDPKFVALLNDADELFALPSCEIIKDQRKIKVARVVLEIDGRVQALYVKRYNAFALRQRVGSMFTPSGGVRALRGAAILNGNGIATATPVAAIEERLQGMVDRSFFLSEEISGGMTVDAYWLSLLLPVPGRDGIKRRRAFVDALGSLLSLLHRQGIYHNDLKDANILAVPQAGGASSQLYLLDLEGVRRYRVLSDSRRLKNLVQLNRTLGGYLAGPQKMRLLRAYLGTAYSDRRRRRDWIDRVVAESKRLDGAKSRQRARATAALPNQATK